MLSRSSLLFFSLAALTSVGFSECGGLAPTSLIPPPPDPLGCETLNEASCIIRSDCRPEYSQELCACPAICQVDPNGGESCIAPPCDCEPAQFEGCVSVGPCQDLDQDQCQATQGCNWQWQYEDGGEAKRAPGDALVAPCECACDSSDGTCPACDCHDPPAPPPPPTGICVPAPPCVSLSEDQCVSTEGCQPIYGNTRCGGGEAPPDGDLVAPCEGDDCGRCDPAVSEYLGCQEETPVCGAVCDIYCQYGNVVDENGCPTCSCNPPPPDDCALLDEDQCNADARCQAQYEVGGCDVPNCEPDPSDPNGGVVCFPCDPYKAYVGCAPAASQECFSDADCPGGFCAFDTDGDGSGARAPCADDACDPPAPPPPIGQCVYPRCDSGIDCG